MSNNNNTVCTCGCCEGSEQLTPEVLTNFPGLSALQYRVGTHRSFKEAMLTALAKFTATRKLTTRDDDDLAIAGLDAWATVLDVLGFYQERIINEGYLRTATERLSVVELAKHLNYKPKPGVAAGTFLVFSMNDAAGAPQKATIPEGTKVQSIPEQDQLPQIFETIEEIEARVAWNNIKLLTKRKELPGYGDKKIYLKGINTGLQPGDGILMIGEERKSDAANENWDFRRIKEVITNNEKNYTKVIWDKGLGKTIGGNTTLPAKLDFRVYAMKQKAFLFGYNAPDFRSISGTVKSQYLSPGIKARYYTGISFDNFVKETTDTIIDNNWGNGSPADLPSDNFSVIWSGWILIPVSGEVTFYTNSDDGVRFYLDGELIINDWSIHGARERSATRTVEGGRLYGFTLEYFEQTGIAVIQLSWSGAGRSKQIIPAANFFTPANNNEWPGFTISAISGEENTIHLDAIYSKIVQGNWIVLSKETYDEVYSVDRSVESSRKNFTLASKTTRLKIEGENLNLFDNDIRNTTVFAQSEEFELAENPIGESPEGNVIQLEKVLTDLAREKIIVISGKRRRLVILPTNDKLELVSQKGEKKELFTGDILIVANIPVINDTTVFNLTDITGFAGSISLKKDQWTFTNVLESDEVHSEVHKITDVTIDNYSTTLTLEDNLTNFYDRNSVNVYINVAKATHGERKEETLGSGNTSLVFQKFELKQKPLTYISAASATGTATTLEIRVNDVLWREVPSLYKALPKEKVYTVNIDDDGKVTVQFGDGITGARLPTGTENVKARYRVGIGTDGMLKASALSMLMTPQLGVNKVNNPLPTSGAEDRETMDSAKRNAPVTVLTLERIVSVKDFEDFARAFAGIGKARADLIWSGEQQSVFITIASVDASEIKKGSELYINLLAAIKSAGKFYKTINLENYERVVFTVDAKVKVDPAYLFENVKKAIEDRLNEKFSFDARDFGQDVTPAEVITVMQQVEGVIYVDLELLNGNKPFEQGIHYRISSEIARRSGPNNLPAQLLTIDPNGITISEILL